MGIGAGSKAGATILDALEAPPVDKDTRSTLQRYLYRRQKFGEAFRDEWGNDGRGFVTLLVRTILESENNQDALIEPIVSAVSLCMRPQWTRKGLAWIEAFDQIPLLTIYNELRELDLFDADELRHFYVKKLMRRLRKYFGPDELTQPAKPAKKKPSTPSKMNRPKDISERTWDDILAIQKRRRGRAKRMAA